MNCLAGDSWVGGTITQARRTVVTKIKYLTAVICTVFHVVVSPCFKFAYVLWSRMLYTLCYAFAKIRLCSCSNVVTIFATNLSQNTIAPGTPGFVRNSVSNKLLWFDRNVANEASSNQFCSVICFYVTSFARIHLFAVLFITYYYSSSICIHPVAVYKALRYVWLSFTRCWARKRRKQRAWVWVWYHW